MTLVFVINTPLLYKGCLDHSSDTAPESRLPGEVAWNVGEVLPVEGNQGGLVGMRTSVDTSLKIAPDKIIHRIEMGLLEGHMLFVTTLLKCSCSQAMALGYITGCRLLLPHPGAISNYPPSIQGNCLLQHLEVDGIVNPEPGLKDVRGHVMGSVSTI